MNNVDLSKDAEKTVIATGLIARITIPGKPRGKGRPRFTQMGRVYTDDATAAYENLVKMAWLKEHPVRFDGPVSVCVVANYQIPASTPKKLQAQMRVGDIVPTVKPDLDNVVKAVLDGLNGVAFLDDKQIVKLTANKQYSDDACVLVTVEGLNST